MSKKTTNINQLVDKILLCLKNFGFPEHTIWGSNYTHYFSILKFYKLHGLSEYSPDIMKDYIGMVKKRYEQDEISKNYLNCLLKAVERMEEVYTNGKLKWSCKLRVSKFKLNNYYKNLLEKFLSYQTFHPNTLGDIIWAIKRYFAYLQLNEHATFDTVKVTNVKDFIIDSSKQMKSGSLHNLKTYVKKFHVYLEETNQSSINYKSILSFKVIREKKMFPCTSQDEIQCILNQIDTSTNKGKRNYAIIKLASLTGLRAIDIACLKLTDINWRKKEINLIQQKTQKTLTLPLIREVSESIKEYIIFGRPESDSEYIFLRSNAPYLPFSSGSAIAYFYNEYQKKQVLKESLMMEKDFILCGEL